jgi:hypothetical protein
VRGYCRVPSMKLPYEAERTAEKLCKRLGDNWLIIIQATRIGKNDVGNRINTR